MDARRPLPIGYITATMSEGKQLIESTASVAGLLATSARRPPTPALSRLMSYSVPTRKDVPRGRGQKGCRRRRRRLSRPPQRRHNLLSPACDSRAACLTCRPAVRSAHKYGALFSYFVLPSSFFCLFLRREHWRTGIPTPPPCRHSAQ